MLADAGADLLLLELVGSIDDAIVSLDAISGTALPVFLGIYISAQGTLQSGRQEDTGESVEDLVDALDDHRVDAILPMCCPPQTISLTVPRLLAAFGGPVGGYANLGYKHSRKQIEYPVRQYMYIEVDYTPHQYVSFAQDWLENGAQIVGGCCASTSEHIAALRSAINGV